MTEDELVSRIGGDYHLVLIFELFEESLVLLADLLCIPLEMVVSFDLNKSNLRKV